MTSLQTAPGHQILAAAGQKFLRPGGKQATQQLWQWANFQPGETVLELAASFGESAIAIASTFGVQVIGIEQNPESVAKAEVNIRAAGLEGQVKIILGDIFNLDALPIPPKFDYVLAEAILSMQPTVAKIKLLKTIRSHLKDGGKFLSHELQVSTYPENLQKSLSQEIKMNVSPLSVSDWQNLCEQARLTVQEWQTGPMQLLSPKRRIKEEGILAFIYFYWKILTNSVIRTRINRMKHIFSQHKQDLGYIVYYATPGALEL